MKPFELAQTIAIIGAIILSLAGSVAFVFVNFETKEAAAKTGEFVKQRGDDIIERLDRIENKVDHLNDE